MFITWCAWFFCGPTFSDDLLNVSAGLFRRRKRAVYAAGFDVCQALGQSRIHVAFLRRREFFRGSAGNHLGSFDTIEVMVWPESRKIQPSRGQSNRYANSSENFLARRP